MSTIRHVAWSDPHDDTVCWAFWREDLPCLNRPTWRVQNTTNAGYSLMCEVHKEGFATDYPDALVVYTRLPQQEEPVA